MKARCRDSLLFLCLVLLCAVVKELLIHLHKQLECIIDQSMDRPATRKKDEVYKRPGPALSARTLICSLLGGILIYYHHFTNLCTV